MGHGEGERGHLNGSREWVSPGAESHPYYIDRQGGGELKL